jgi:hypothetical protein
VINLEKLNQVLQAIFYLVWIFVGFVLVAGSVFLIAANPLKQIEKLMSNQSGSQQLPSQGAGSFGQQGGGQQGEFGQPSQQFNQPQGQPSVQNGLQLPPLPTQ